MSCARAGSSGTQMRVHRDGRLVRRAGPGQRRRRVRSATVSVSYHAGHRHGAKARVALFVDERASDEQQQALADAFAGNLGGPLAELAEMTEKVSSVHRAPISFSFEASTTKVTVGQAVTVTMRPLVGATDRVITIADSAMASVLGPQAQVGVASSYQLDLPGEGFDLNLEARSANRGRFSYLAR